jgi:acyl dehydratase
MDRDAQRVPILQGPVAVKYSQIVDEPVKDILGNIYSSHIKSIRDMYYGSKADNIPTVEYLGARGGSSPKRPGVSVSELPGEEGITVMYETARLSADLPADSDYLDILAQQNNTWLRAFLTSPSIVRGHLLVPNPIQRILRPRPRQTVFVQLDKIRSPQLLTVYDQAQTGIPSRHPAVVISHEGDDITLTLYERRDNDYVPLQFIFQYRPGLYPIHEVMEGRNQRIKSFYGKLWYVDEKAFKLSTQETFKAQFRVDRQRISDFTNVIGNTAEMYVSNGNAKAPMDFAIVAGWQALVTAILPKEIDGDLLRLVHLSNEFRMLDQSGMLEAGDDISAEAVIDAVIISEMGKTVEVKATLFKRDRPLLEILSRFLYRGNFSDYENTFRRTVENPMQVDLKTNKDVAVLREKNWVNWQDSSAELSVGSTVIFRLKTLTKFKNDKLFSKVSTTGAIFLKTSRETVEIGTVAHEDADCVGNVVLEYLNRTGAPIEQAIYFKTGGYSILPDPKVFPAVVTVPNNNDTYARASGDLNPIHVNPYFADLAGLPGTITHGMWTSASTRKFVEIFAANNHPDRVKEYNVKFVDMVLPGDQLETKLYHVGMINGRKLIKIETYKLGTGAKVLEGTAGVDQPITSYVFTGQGSQEPAMGMDLYAST